MPSTFTAELADAPLAQSPHRNRLTVRARLALTYAALVTVAGVVLLVIVSVFIGLVPSYSFGDTAALIAADYAGEPFELSGATAPEFTTMGPTASTAPTAPINDDIYSIVVDPSLVFSPAIAVTVSSRSDVLQLLLGVSAGALVILAAGGAWAGWFLAGRMLRPLQYVNAAAHQAAAGHLDHRIALAGPRDEISELADTFDNMLGEIERSVNSHRRFAANASHELRTPLATTRAMLDVALSSAASTEEKELLGRLRETNERSIDTVESLLDLSEIEAVAATIEPVDLAGLTASVIDEASHEAAEAGVTLSHELEPAVVDGDTVLLRQLIGNLVLNAVRHNERGGVAEVSISVDGDAVLLEVSNTGTVVSEETVEQLADPFYRGRGRTNEASVRGRGLGLSIVSAIVDRHDGALTIESREAGGLTVRVRFRSAWLSDAKTGFLKQGGSPSV